ncbi:MAG TPA: hypothetical protein VM183_12625, partial [Burkholderiales bacterium]|nr:hypothetical protein [Burkholderiales bacterium]
GLRMRERRAGRQRDCEKHCFGFVLCHLLPPVVICTEKRAAAAALSPEMFLLSMQSFGRPTVSKRSGARANGPPNARCLGGRMLRIRN